MKSENFTFLQGLLRHRTGVVMDSGKEYLVTARLAQMARRQEFASVDALVDQLRSRPFGPAHKAVLDALVTTETSFFRDVHPFESLKEVVLPELARKRALTRSFNIWSAGCSSGQEPYSLAMLLKEHFPHLTGWSIRIVASDLSADMVQRAREGTYSQLEINRGMPARLLTRYFERRGVMWQIAPDVRTMVEFREINLTEPLPPLPTMDLIFLRNVLIYFDDASRREILQRLARQLRPDGYLFVGSAETMISFEELFRRVRINQTSCYQVREERGA